MENELKSPFKTPARSTVVYFDENGNVVSKEEGVRVHITEFDENDEIINEVWGNYTPKKEKTR